LRYKPGYMPPCVPGYTFLVYMPPSLCTLVCLPVVYIPPCVPGYASLWCIPQCVPGYASLWCIPQCVPGYTSLCGIPQCVPGLYLPVCERYLLRRVVPVLLFFNVINVRKVASLGPWAVCRTPVSLLVVAVRT